MSYNSSDARPYNLTFEEKKKSTHGEKCDQLIIRLSCFLWFFQNNRRGGSLSLSQGLEKESWKKTFKFKSIQKISKERVVLLISFSYSYSGRKQKAEPERWTRTGFLYFIDKLVCICINNKSEIEESYVVNTGPFCRCGECTYTCIWIWAMTRENLCPTEIFVSLQWQNISERARRMPLHCRLSWVQLTSIVNRMSISASMHLLNLVNTSWLWRITWKSWATRKRRNNDM